MAGGCLWDVDNSEDPFPGPKVQGRDPLGCSYRPPTRQEHTSVNLEWGQQKKKILQKIRWTSSSWCPTLPGLMWREYSGCSWRMKELMPLTVPAWPKSHRTPLDIMFQSVARLHLRWSRSSVMPWFRSGRKWLQTPSAISLGLCLSAVRHAYKYMGPSKLHSFELMECNFGKMDYRAASFFTLTLCRLVIFISIKWCGNFHS